MFLDRLALLRTKFAFWFPPFSNRIHTEGSCPSARKIRARPRGRSAPARAEVPRRPRGSSAAPARKFRGARAEVPRRPRGSSAAPARKFRGARAEVPRRPRGSSAAPARIFRGTRAENPRRSARNNHGIPRKKFSFPCHVLYICDQTTELLRIIAMVLHQP